MNTLEVTYADKAGRLTEGSPDKVKIKELEQALGKLDTKSAKVYHCEDATQLTPEQQDEILNDGYNFIKDDLYGYLITVNKEDNLQFITLDVEENIINGYWYDSGEFNNYTIELRELSYNVMDGYNSGDILTLDNFKRPVWKAPVTGTKLYKHRFTFTLSDGTNYFTVYLNINSITNTQFTASIQGSYCVINLKGKCLELSNEGCLFATDSSHNLYVIAAGPWGDNQIYFGLTNIHTIFGTMPLTGITSVISVSDTVTEL